MVFGLCLVGVVLFVLLGCFLCCLPLFFVSAWWNRGIADEVTIASFCKAVTGTAVMARSANEKKNRSFNIFVVQSFLLQFRILNSMGFGKNIPFLLVTNMYHPLSHTATSPVMQL